METVVNTLDKLPVVIGFIFQFSFFVLLSFILRWFWKNVLIRMSRKTATNLDLVFFKATVTAVQTAFIAISFSFSWKLYGEAILKKLDGISWFNTDSVWKMSNHLCFLFITFSVIYLIWKAVFAFVDWFERDVALKTETIIDEKIIYTLRKILKAGFVVITIMIIADHFDAPFSKLWAAAGIGSLAVALAAKDTFANIISGIIILFDRPFLVGDRVELTDGTFGDVVDIGLRSTKILSFDNTINIIPNAEISTQRITNHTYPDNTLRVAHHIGVAYGSDMEKIKRVINKILSENLKVLNDPEWGVYFTEFGDSSLNLLIRYWIQNYKDKFIIMDEINMIINRRFEEEHIEIPFPQQDVHFYNHSEK